MMESINTYDEFKKNGGLYHWVIIVFAHNRGNDK